MGVHDSCGNVVKKAVVFVNGQKIFQQIVSQISAQNAFRVWMPDMQLLQKYAELCISFGGCQPFKFFQVCPA